MKDRCKNCSRFPFCMDTDEEECNKWKRQPYTVLKEVDGNIKKIERID